jgi:hypothetical protein
MQDSFQDGRHTLSGGTQPRYGQRSMFRFSANSPGSACGAPTGEVAEIARRARPLLTNRLDAMRGNDQDEVMRLSSVEPDGKIADGHSGPTGPTGAYGILPTIEPRAVIARPPHRSPRMRMTRRRDPRRSSPSGRSVRTPAPDPEPRQQSQSIADRDRAEQTARGHRAACRRGARWRRASLRRGVV